MKQLTGESSITGGHRPQAGQLAMANSRPAAAPEQAIFQPELARSLRMHGKLALLTVLIGLALSAFYFSRLWPIYEGKSLLFVQPAPSSLMNQNQANRWPIDGATYETFLAQKMADVTRPDVLIASLHKMEPGLWQKTGESDQAAAERLSHAIQVERSGSYQMSIAVRAATPEKAAALTNAVTSAYVETSARDSKASDTQRLAILKEEHSRVQADLAADRAEQATLSRQLGMASSAPNAPDLYDEQIARTRDELIRVRTEHDEAAARFSSMNAASGDASNAIDAQAEEVAAADPGLGSMKTSLNQRKATLVSQMSGLTPNHPLYKQDQAELDKINSELEAASRKLHTQAANRIQQKLRSDLERTAAVEEKLNSQLRSAVGAAAGASIKIQRANDLNADIARLQNRYAAVDEQLHNLMLDSGAPGAISLIQAAVPPLHAIRSGVFRNTLVLALGSIFLGLFLAVLAHKLDPKIYIASDVESVLGFAPMAQLPHFAQISEEVEAEHLIRLAGDIEHIALADGIHTVALTSAAEGAGVGSLASRLRPLLTPAANGLDPVDLPQGVNLVEAGPLLVSAEAEFQVRRAGWTIAVIESGVTTRAELRTMASVLKRLDAPAVGFILHQISLEKADPAFRRAVAEAERHVGLSGGTNPTRILEQRQRQAGLAPAYPQQEQLPAPQPVQTYQTQAAPAPIAALPAAPAAAHEPWWMPQQEPAPQPTVARRVPPPLAPLPERPAATSFAASYPPAPAPQPPVPAVEPQPSRLNGLRGTAFQQGLMNLNRGNEPRAEAQPAESWQPELPRLQPAPQPMTQHFEAYQPPAAVPSAGYAVPAEPMAQLPRPEFRPVPPAAAPEPAGSRFTAAFDKPQPQPSQPTEVAFAPSRSESFAEPEILPPPREFIPVRDGEGDEEGNASRDRRESWDDLEILPSWRGQYRKRS